MWILRVNYVTGDVGSKLHVDSYLGNYGDVTVLNAFVRFILILVPLEYRRGYLVDS